MGFWDHANIAQATGGVWLEQPSPAAPPVRGVSIDSRAVSAGQLFIAIKGEKFDGHDFVDLALRSGAAMAIVSRPPKLQPSTGSPILLVRDTVAALQRLAAAHREGLKRVIAVVGSNGKTTTRGLIHTVLCSALRGTQSPKSFNNHLGVPLTLLSAREEEDFVVVEVGTNHPGEIDALGRIVRPDAAVIVSIGQEHMEFFGTLEAVAAEEASILAHVRPGGLAVVIDDEPASSLLREHVQRQSSRLSVVRFSSRQLRRCETSERGVRFATESMSVELPLLGRHNAVNALAAVEVGRWAGLSDGAVARALASAAPPTMRLNVKSLGPVTVIDDCYNANLDSMTRALEVLREYGVGPTSVAWDSTGRRVAVLGDMLELGESGPECHRKLGGLIADHADLAVLVGRLSLFAAEALLRHWPPERVVAFAQWSAEVPTTVAALLRAGDVVLVKASRGTALERVIPAIEQRFGTLSPASQRP